MNFTPILLALSLAVTAAQAADKPNILVFLVDDMGLMDTSLPFLTDAKGQPEKHPLNELYRTPNMEDLASRGMRFETFYANSVCSPTRVSIMTGQSSARHHTTQWIRSEGNNRGPQGPPDWKWEGITEGQQTLAGLLQKDGYRTIYAGKAHFGPNDAYGEFPDNFGFDVNIGGCSWGQPGSYYGQDGFGWIKGNKSRAVPHLEKYHGKDIYLTDALTLEMNAAIKKAVEDEEPFFAYMAYYGLHAPFMPNERYAGNYADADIPKNAKAFATMVESMDASVGEILKQLDTLGVAEDTLVLFLGDNGSDAPLGKTHTIASSAPLRGKKGTHYEGGMRVPFIAAWAKQDADNPSQKKLPITRGTITTEMGTIHDIFPTVLELVGVDYESPIDGDNLAPALNGGTFDGKRDFLMHFPHSHRSSYYTVYRLGDWKLVYHYNKPAGQRCELFNLAKDPTEADNKAKTQPEVLGRMIQAMSKELEGAGAQYPVDKKDPTIELKPVAP
ncbi:sulfatase [Haloferula rosea]|uniref:Sulfatase n=1 Tax=Haloferula rosea TaxID=490093 RepID=A0A934RDI1_9BACT|nr:sulfatase [Haloferula rosea]MBK1827259.1 sulfatase [Haloferula rosea]